MEIWPKVIASLLTPPGVIVLIAIIGFLFQFRWRLLGMLVSGASIGALLVLSAPLTGTLLLAGLENNVHALSASDTTAAQRGADVIVVLGAGRRANAPEYGEDDIGTHTLERLRYAARLQRATRLPILVSGGAPFGVTTPVAILMRAALKRDFDVEPRWIEAQSRNTFENAQRSFAMLGAAGITRIYLVTHAWHMPRALWSFERAGFDVAPAPMGFTTINREDRGPLDYLPMARGLASSSLALNERLALAWYTFKFTGEEPSGVQTNARAPR
jgi:uncharacterized SAM-binding protein YcdF (DUF218 family)